MTMATTEGRAADPLHPRTLSFLSRKPLTAARAARIIAFVTVSLTVVSGVVIHFLDRANFPNIGGGMWWAVQTVTTVGYGDAVPTSTGGRLVAVLVMVLGIGFLTVVTAAITSTFVEAARGRMQAGASEPLEAKLDRISARLDAIETKLAEITPEGR
jgi:voltage-gated potassium channel